MRVRTSASRAVSPSGSGLVAGGGGVDWDAAPRSLVQFALRPLLPTTQPSKKYRNVIGLRDDVDREDGGTTLTSRRARAQRVLADRRLAVDLTRVRRPLPATH